jgi:hypothetical protein
VFLPTSKPGLESAAAAAAAVSLVRVPHTGPEAENSSVAHPYHRSPYLGTTKPDMGCAGGCIHPVLTGLCGATASRTSVAEQ